MKLARVFGATCAAVACGGLAAASASAQSFVPTEDNFVWKGGQEAVQSNGATFNLKEASTAQGNARFAYLKFDLSSLPSIADPVRFTATLTAGVTADFTLQLYVLKPGTPGFDWTETGITYNNRPAPSGANPLIDTTKATAVGGNLALPTGTPAGATTSFTFSGIDGYRQSDNTVTLIFLTSSQSNFGPQLTFASSEATVPANAPTLTVVPEPPAAAAGGLLAAGIVLRRRRRA